MEGYGGADGASVVFEFLLKLLSLLLFFALENLGQKFGKSLEPKLFLKWGGKPSVSIMRNSDNSLDKISKLRYMTYLSNQLAQPLDQNIEVSNASANDAFYESAGNLLRERTRDQKTFPILFKENIQYGFRRNLFGLKQLSIVLNFGVSGLGVILLMTDLLKKVIPNPNIIILIAMIFVNICQAAYFLLAATEDTVQIAAKSYARQLILSCEVLIQNSNPKT